MARPSKIGLNYFNIDTDRYSDIKIRKLKKQFKCTGLCVYDYLICSIYKNGCFLNFNENVIYDVAEYLDLEETEVINIIKFCVEIGFFDENLFNTKNVLTSNGIQKRYILICKNAKIKFDIPNFIILKNTEEITKTSVEIIKNTEEITKTSVESTQSKLKENKVKETLYESDQFESNFYSEKEFLEDWKIQRLKFDKMPTNILKLDFHEKNYFIEILKNYERDKINNGIIGLFQQKNMYPANRLRPKHFLENFEKYLDCFVNKQQLFEQNNKNGSTTNETVQRKKSDYF